MEHFLLLGGEVQRGQFLLIGIRDQVGENLDEVVHLATAAGMFDLGYVFKLIDDRFDDRSLAQHQFVKQRHQAVFHVAFESSNELESASEELVKQALRDVSPVAEEFSPELTGQLVDGDAVIDVAGGDACVEEFATVVGDPMEFEAEEPSGGGFSAL